MPNQPPAQPGTSSPTPSDSTETKTKPSEWIFALTVLACWIGLMVHLTITAVLPQRSEANLLASAGNPADLVANWKDIRDFMVIRAGRREVGAASTTVIRDDNETGYRADFRLALSLNLLGRDRQVQALGAAELDPQFQLISFVFNFQADPVRIQVVGLVSGLDMYVRVENDGFGEPVHRRIVLDRPISLMDAVMPAATRNMEIKPGAEYALSVVDPIWSMDHGVLAMRVKPPETIRLGRSDVEAYPVDLSLHDYKTRIYVDAQGKVLRRTLIGQYTLDTESEARALMRSDVLKMPLEIPQLKADEFTQVEATSMRGLTTGKNTKTPLSFFQGLAP